MITRRVLADDIAAHRAWWGRFAALWAIFAAIIAALVILLTGCNVGLPCSNHGGVHWTNTKVYQCNDGTWE